MLARQPNVEDFRQHLSRWVAERLSLRSEELDRSSDFGKDLFRELGSREYLRREAISGSHVYPHPPGLLLGRRRAEAPMA